MIQSLILQDIYESCWKQANAHIQNAVLLLRKQPIISVILLVSTFTKAK